MRLMPAIYFGSATRARGARREWGRQGRGWCLQRRIEFHGARNPNAAAVAAAPGGFRIEMLRGDTNRRVAAGRDEGEGRRFERGESSGSGFDPEVIVGRVYLRRIEGQTARFYALCALQTHVRSALRSTGKILTPRNFVNNLRCISRSFHNSRHEDAHELMVTLLESMHKCCLPSGVPIESPSAYGRSLVHRIFDSRLRSQILEISNATTLMEALQDFTQEELLDGGEK
ncbi:hypothetical protein ACP4OV_000433 [Aristida adscensionis]